MAIDNTGTLDTGTDYEFNLDNELDAITNQYKPAYLSDEGLDQVATPQDAIYKSNFDLLDTMAANMTKNPEEKLRRATRATAWENLGKGISALAGVLAGGGQNVVPQAASMKTIDDWNEKIKAEKLAYAKSAASVHDTINKDVLRRNQEYRKEREDVRTKNYQTLLKEIQAKRSLIDKYRQNDWITDKKAQEYQNRLNLIHEQGKESRLTKQTVGAGRTNSNRAMNADEVEIAYQGLTRQQREAADTNSDGTISLAEKRAAVIAAERTNKNKDNTPPSRRR